MIFFSKEFIVVVLCVISRCLGDEEDNTGGGGSSSSSSSSDVSSSGPSWITIGGQSGGGVSVGTGADGAGFVSFGSSGAPAISFGGGRSSAVSFGFGGSGASSFGFGGYPGAASFGFSGYPGGASFGFGGSPGAASFGAGGSTRSFGSAGSLVSSQGSLSGQCPAFLSPIPCHPPPCSVNGVCTNIPIARCVNDFCQCRSRFYVGPIEVTDSCGNNGHCPPDRPPVPCPVDPCSYSFCPRFPQARCVAYNCGSCYARFFINRVDVTDRCYGPIFPGQQSSFQQPVRQTNHVVHHHYHHKLPHLKNFKHFG